MKKNNKIWICPFIFMGFVFILINSCKKDDSNNNNNNNPTGQVPVLATSVVSYITGTSATCGGTVTSDGGATVTARGVCWSTGLTPTISDSKTTDGTGTGLFTSSITGLAVGNSYYVRAYATNSVGTSYGNKVFFTVGIGASYQGGIIAYIFQAGDPGFVVGQTHGLIVAASDQSTSAEWGCSGTLITGANATALGTGNQNTIDIMADCSTSATAARLCGDLVSGGYSDWYLPNIYELGLVRINKAAIGVFAGDYYWSSLQSDANSAHAENFGSGSASAVFNKNINHFVRAVRVF